MNTLLNLLILYLAILAFNVALAFVFWHRNKTVRNRSLLQLWVGTSLGIFVQALLSQNLIQIIFAVAISGFVSFPVAVFAGVLSDRNVRLLPYGFALTIATGVGLTIALVGGPSWLALLPVSAASAAPLFIESARGLASRFAASSTVGKVFFLSALAQSLHYLDYPFLREKPDLAPLGFTVAIAIVFAMSISSMGSALEVTAAEKARVEHESVARTRFFENVSHELRTPLTLILAPLESLLLDKDIELPKAAREYLLSIQRSAAGLMQLVNNLLDLAKADAGGLYFNYEQVAMREVLEQLLPPFVALARSRSIELNFTASATGDVTVDRDKIDVVLRNLLANALKFTSAAGSVDVQLSETDTEVIVAISDTGIGIRDQDLSRIFERFAQAQGEGEGEGARGFGGTGIGLALVKEFTEFHGGRVTVKSTPKVGSTFTVYLPKGTAHVRDDLRDRRSVDVPVGQVRRRSDRDPVVAVARREPRAFDELREPAIAPADEGSAQEPASAPRVLVVEDNHDLRRFLRSIIGKSHRTLEAEDGRSGISIAQREVPDLIVSDVSMPHVSGLELVRALKANPRTKSIPIILLTARRGVDPALEGFAAGADDYVNKPFNPKELLARIAAQFRIQELSRQLAQAQKSSLLVTLSAGLAHEIRNPLNAILNGLPVIRERAVHSAKPADAEIITKLTAIATEAANRILSLLQGLQEFSNADRAPVRDWEPVNAIESTLRLMSHRLEGIIVERDFQPTGALEGYATQLNQVLLNLIDNAARAVAGRSPLCRIRVSVRGEQDGTAIIICDNGPGIAGDVLPRIFDPFFTTRAVGDGTGLGLHISRQVVEAHGGELTVQSTLGQGASFRVWLPRRRAHT